MKEDHVPAIQYMDFMDGVPLHSRTPVTIQAAETSFGTIFLGVLSALICWTLLLFMVAILYVEYSSEKTTEKSGDSFQCQTCLIPTRNA